MKPLEQFICGHFIVLDKRSIGGETCLIVLGSADFNENNEMSTLRTDFDVSMVSAAIAERDMTNIGENLVGERCGASQPRY